MATLFMPLYREKELVCPPAQGLALPHRERELHEPPREIVPGCTGIPDSKMAEIGLRQVVIVNRVPIADCTRRCFGKADLLAFVPQALHFSRTDPAGVASMQ